MTLQLPSGVKLPRIPNLSNVEILEVNDHARTIQSKISHDIKNRLVKSRNTSQHKKKTSLDIQYNKWYIDPTMRYISVPKNPKQNTKFSQDPQYIYTNLHNKQFWNWIHPLQAKSHSGQLPQTQPIDKNKVNIRVLQDFKKSMQDSKKRIPLIVQQMLSKR